MTNQLLQPTLLTTLRAVKSSLTARAVAKLGRYAGKEQ